MDDQQEIVLRPATSSLVAACAMLVFVVAGLALIGVTQLGAPGSGHIPVPFFLSALALIVGGGIGWRVTRPRTLILEPEGVRVRERAGESVTPWRGIESVVLRRIPKAKGTEPAVVILRTGEPPLTFRSHYATSPEALFAAIDGYVRAHAIAVRTEARSLDFDPRNWMPER
jgi:hypothetical protein